MQVSPPRTPEQHFHTTYDVARIVRTPETQRQSMLSGYNLRDELHELMGGSTALSGK